MSVSVRHILCLFLLLCIQCNGVEVDVSRKLKKVDKNADLEIMKTHLPLKDGDNVYFWRLQKVGSSTMLSILMSYGYRYNFLPRRKGSSNSQCRRIGQCALDNAELHGLMKNETSKLKRYIEAKTPGSSKTNLPITQTVINSEAVTSSIPFKISLGHELCNLDEKHVRNNLVCSFTNPEWTKKFKQGAPVKEIFMVRDPVSRAISVYYFWGELFKLAKVNKEIQEQQHAKEIEDAQAEAETVPKSRTKAINAKKPGGRITSEDVSDDERDKQPRGGAASSSKGSISKSNAAATTVSHSSSGHTVIQVKGKLAETPHGKRDSSGKSSAARKRDIRQFGRMLGEEDPAVLEEVERILTAATAEGENDEEVDYYTSAAYLSDLAATMARANSPFKRSSSSNSVAARRLVADGGSDDVRRPKLGSTTNYNKTVDGKMFIYHGDEMSVPPIELAMGYAASLPFTAGMPGPSLTYSAFSNKLSDALKIIKSDRMVTVVVERLDESLVVASHYLGWSLADMVVTKHRKALSSHPKSTEWPQAAISAIRNKLNLNGEYTLYNASRAKLDERIGELKKKGVDVPQEVKTLQALQKRVTSICLDDTYLLNYREDLKDRGYPQHPSENKLRDVEEKYVEQGHIFSFNREILCSFDVCGSCEAHALLLNTAKGGISEGKSIEEAATLSLTPMEKRRDNINFEKCPTKFTYPLPSAVAKV